jgi:hypothetical protein
MILPETWGSGHLAAWSSCLPSASFEVAFFAFAFASILINLAVKTPFCVYL